MGLDDRRVRRRARACRGRSGRLRHRSRWPQAGAARHGALVVPFFLAFLCRRRDGHPVRPSLCRAGAPGASLGPGLRHRASGPYRIVSSGWASSSARFRCRAACCGSSWSHCSSPALLALLSFGIGMRNLGRLWRPLLFLGTTYILIAFGRFCAGRTRQRHSIGSTPPNMCRALMSIEPLLPRFFASASLAFAPRLRT